MFQIFPIVKNPYSYKNVWGLGTWNRNFRETFEMKNFTYFCFLEKFSNIYNFPFVMAWLNNALPLSIFLKYNSLVQLFSNIKVHQNHTEKLKHKFLVWEFLILWIWIGARELAFLTSSRVIPISWSGTTLWKLLV